jgi:hypothetical protein
VVSAVPGTINPQLAAAKGLRLRMEIVNKRKLAVRNINWYSRTVVLMHLEKIAVIAGGDLSINVRKRKGLAIESSENVGKQLEQALPD